LVYFADLINLLSLKYNFNFSLIFMQNLGLKPSDDGGNKKTHYPRYV